VWQLCKPTGLDLRQSHLYGSLSREGGEESQGGARGDVAARLALRSAARAQR